jgi:hypothetical protein
LWQGLRSNPGALLGFGPGPRGKSIIMTDDRTDRRAAELLPEERAAGSDDPRAQAEAILADSDRREDDPESDEERSSGETVTPESTR